MKSILSALLLGLSLTGVSLVGANVNQNDQSQPADEYKLPVFKVPAISRLPQIARQVNPQVPAGLAGTSFKLKFQVTERGYARKVKTDQSLQRLAAVNEQSADFAVQMCQLLKSWKFQPALDANGLPVKVHIVMPVQVVKANGSTQTHVVLMLDEAAYQES